jgi:hypothetical protein
VTDKDRDKLIIEMHTDIRWIKAWSVEHKQTHAKYVWYFISTILAFCLSWFR